MNKLFNNCNQLTNGENYFYSYIKNNIKIIFDVGCRNDSLFIDFEGEVHYFDPVESFITKLQKTSNKNKISIYNNFGLGERNEELFYFPRYESFYNRINSCKIDDSSNKVLLNIKKPKDYIIEKNIKNIDFLKIDTEGFELNILKGFEEYLNIVKIIQFEYGGTNLDNNVSLKEIINYLKNNGFKNFCYLYENGLYPITDYNDHYNYCNIVCINENSDYNPQIFNN